MEPPAGDTPDGTGPALSLRWSEGAAGRDPLWGAAARPLPILSAALSSRSELQPHGQPRSTCRFSSVSTSQNHCTDRGKKAEDLNFFTSLMNRYGLKW